MVAGQGDSRHGAKKKERYPLRAAGPAHQLQPQGAARGEGVPVCGASVLGMAVKRYCSRACQNKAN